MPAIEVTTFAGVRPAISPRRLGPGEAQIATNAKLSNTALRPMLGTTSATALSTAVQTIYRYGQTASDTASWLTFADDADVVLSPVLQDQFKRLYWSTASTATVRYAPEQVAIGAGTLPSASYQLGIPKPTAAPTAAGTAATVYAQERREYIVVFTGTTNSAPSPVTSVTAVSTFEVKLTRIPVPETGTAYTGKNLYRRDANVSGSSFKLVASLATSATEYTDTIATANLGAAYTIPTVSTVPIPSSILADAPALTTNNATSSRYYAYTTGGYSRTTISGDFTSIDWIVEDNLSPASMVSVDTTQSVTVSALSAGTTGATYFRIYRRDGSTGGYQLIAQIPVAQTSYLDSSSELSGAAYGGPSYPTASASTPATAPTLTASTSTAINVASLPRRVYCATYVSSSGAEGARSAESNVVIAVDGVTPVTVTLPYLSQTELAAKGLSKVRIYRRTVVVTNGAIDTDEANYRLLAEVPAQQQAYTDSATAASITSQAALPSASRGLTTIPDGTMAASGYVPSDVVPESRVYVYTYVSEYGEEGPPSDASASVDIDPALAVTVSGLSVAPAGGYNITKKRVYRSSVGTKAATYQFVAEIPIATTSYSDSIEQANLGEVLPTRGWVAAGTGVGGVPYSTCNPAMKGLTLGANGIVAGFVEKTIHFSEPFQPHTYPAAYSQVTEFNVVGLAAFAQSFAVLTVANPYIVSGSDPSAMTLTKLPLQQGCVAKRSICAYGGGVVYASPDGLVFVGDGGAKILTRGLLSRDQWQAYSPSSMLVKQYDDRLYVFHPSGCLVLDFSGESATLSTFSQTADAAYYDPIQDRLYLAKNGVGILRWDSGTAMAYTWRTRINDLGRPVNLACAQVEANSYPVTFSLYADAVLRYTLAVPSREPFRLPGGYRARDWEIELSGTAEVYRLAASEAMGDI